MSTSEATVRVELASDLSALEALADEWRELEACALDANAYLSPDFVIPALRHVPNGRHLVVRIHRCFRGTRRLIGCAALSPRATMQGLPFPTMSTWAHPHAFLGTPLLHRDHAEDAARALWDWLDDQRDSWLMCRWQRIPLESRTWRLCRNLLSERGRDSWIRYRYDRPALQRKPSFDAWFDSLSSSRRKGFRRQWRALEREGELELLLHRDASDAGVAGRFLELEGRSWKGREGTAMSNQPGGRAFLSEVTTRFGKRQALLFTELRVRGKTVAMTTNFVSGGMMFAFKVAYDPDLHQRSPGILAEVQTVRFFHEETDLEVADSGTRADSYLASYWRDTIPIGEVLVAHPKAMSRGALRLLSAAQGAKRATSRLAATSLPASS